MKKKRNNKRKQDSIWQNQPKYIRDFRQRLFSEKRNPQQLFHGLQAYGQYQEIVSVVQLFRKPANPFHRFVYGMPFARTYTDFRFHPPFLLTDDLEKELNWLSISILRYATEISHFVEQSFAFQRAFLLGNYEQANQVLETIIHCFGFSLWAMEKSFLLKETSAGLEANKTLLTEIVKNDANDVFLGFLAHFVSMRAESKISPENYRLKLLRTIDHVKWAPLRNYLLYRLDYLGMDLQTSATHVAYFEGCSPILDRYLTFLALCQSCAVKGGQLQDIVSETVQRLDGKIQDPRIDSVE